MDLQNLNLSSIPPEALSSAMSALAQNPELLSSIGSMLGSLGGTVEAASEPVEPMGDSTPAGASGVLGALGASGASGGGDILGNLSPILSMLGASAKKAPKNSQRDALLCALKPYLNDERCKLIDSVLKLEQFGDILKMIK